MFSFITRKTSKKINETNLWSNSLTKETLTDYAEGIACNNFDTRHKYNVRQIDTYKWFVLAKNVGIMQKLDHNAAIKYDRVRKVLIDSEGYMSCSCGYVQRMLMPCRHICAVIGNPAYYIPSMFHVRWYKKFYYYYRPTYKEKVCERTTIALDQLLDVTRKSCYSTSMRYKGIYVKDSEFFENLPPLQHTNDETMKLMYYIVELEKESKLVISGSYDINNVILPKEPVVNETIQEECNSVTAEYDNLCYGGSSELQTNLSQLSENYREDNIGNGNKPVNNYFRDGMSAYEEMMRTCPNEAMFEECMTFMRNQSMKHIITKANVIKPKCDKSTVLFKENPTKNKSIKRTKTISERLIGKNR